MPTFAEAAARVLEQLRPGWRSTRHAKDWVSSLRVYAFPQLGHRPVGEITTADILAVLTPIWHDKRVTARRVRQRIGAVMKWAVAMGLRPDNPASDVLGQALGRQQAVVQHMRALHHSKVAGAMEMVRKSHAYPATKLAFEFLVLTAARSGEVRLAHWDEIDLEAREWTVPAERTKAHRPHRVPLSGRAVEILSEARTLGGGSGLVFPSPEGRASAHSRLSTLLRDLGIAAVPHGFRSSFRDWCGECSNAPREVAEAALAHAVRNKVEAAYARSDLFERRRVLMDNWAAYLAGERLGPGGRTGSLIRRARSVGGRVRQALKSGGAKAGSRPVSSHEPAYPVYNTGAGEGWSPSIPPESALTRISRPVAPAPVSPVATHPNG